MQAIFNIINIPLSWVLRFLTSAFNGNFAASVFVFTLLINLAFIPLTIKSQKASVQQLRIKPKLDELKKKYGDDKQKYSAAMQQMYQEENIGMSGGCLPMIFRMLVILSIYWLITQPITYLMNVDKEVIQEAVKALDLGKTARSQELAILSAIQDKAAQFPEIYNAAKDIDFNFFGINLLNQPQFDWNIFKGFQPIWLLPIASFAAQFLSSLFSIRMQKKNNPEAPTMSGMLLMMPLMSLWIGFSVPGGLSFYWACSSLIGGFIQIAVQQLYGPHRLLSKARCKELVKQCDFEETQIKKFGTNSQGGNNLD